MVKVLNKNYSPIGFMSDREAICRLFTGRVEAVDESYNGYNLREWSMVPRNGGRVIVSPGMSLSVPLTVRCLEYGGFPKIGLRPTRDSLLKRDGGRCYICGKPLTKNTMTVDHIIPRSRGGESTWENMACCCMKCNQRKADKTLEEIGVKMKIVPKKPDFVPC